MSSFKNTSIESKHRSGVYLCFNEYERFNVQIERKKNEISMTLNIRAYYNFMLQINPAVTNMPLKEFIIDEFGVSIDLCNGV